MGKIFCVEFQRYHLKFHTNYLAHTLKDMFLYNIEILRALRFKSWYAILKRPWSPPKIVLDLLSQCTAIIHYNYVIMSTMASQITSLTIVYSTVYSATDQRKHQNSGSLAFVRGIHRWPVNSPHKGPVTRKMFPFDGIIMNMVNFVQNYHTSHPIAHLWEQHMSFVSSKSVFFYILDPLWWHITVCQKCTNHDVYLLIMPWFYNKPVCDNVCYNF